MMTIFTAVDVANGPCRCQFCVTTNIFLNVSILKLLEDGFIWFVVFLGGCIAVDCSSGNSGNIPGEDGSVSASANIFVLDPGEIPSKTKSKTAYLFIRC